jgi:hypothetical protein
MNKAILTLVLSTILIGCDVNDSTSTGHFATSLNGGVCDTLWEDVRNVSMYPYSVSYIEQLSDGVLKVTNADSPNDTVLWQDTSIWSEGSDNGNTAYVYRYHLITYDTNTVSMYMYLSDATNTMDNLISNTVPNTSPLKITLKGDNAVFHMVHRAAGDTFSVKLQRLYCK